MNSIRYKLNVGSIDDKVKCYEEQMPEAVAGNVLKNVEKFTGNHLLRSLFLNKVAGLSPATLFKRRLRHRCFRTNFAMFLSTTIL